MIPRLDLEPDERPRRRLPCVGCRVYQPEPGTQRCLSCTSRPGHAPNRPTVKRERSTVEWRQQPCRMCGELCPTSPVSRPQVICGEECRRQAKKESRAKHEAARKAAKQAAS